MTFHSHSTASKNTPDMSVGLNPSKHIDKMVWGFDFVDHGSVNSSSNDKAVDFLPLYDINSVGVEEKFANRKIRFKQFSESQISLGADTAAEVWISL